MVREISRMPKEKVDLKIVLDDTDELSKLRREKNILLDRLDKAAERPGDAKNEGAKKKDTSGLHFTNPFATVIEPPVTAPKVETPPLILPVIVQPNQPPTTVVPAPAPAAKEARIVPPEEVPLVKVPVVSEASPATEEKPAGLLHRIGRWFRQLNRRLRIY
jgi:hypothetical protein